jgi:hypothetical protein
VLTLEQAKERLLLRNRNDGPELLLTWFMHETIDLAVMRAILLDVWRGCEWPLRTMSRRTWLYLFRLAGFVSDTNKPAPQEALWVWRAQIGRTRGLAWTTSKDTALWFHKRNCRFGFEGRLLHGVVRPTGVLALVDGRQEAEVILDPGFLGKVSEVKP